MVKNHPPVLYVNMYFYVFLFFFKLFFYLFYNLLLYDKIILNIYNIVLDDIK